LLELAAFFSATQQQIIKIQISFHMVTPYFTARKTLDKKGNDSTLEIRFSFTPWRSGDRVSVA
jgi:hypothetical protein